LELKKRLRNQEKVTLKVPKASFYGTGRRKCAVARVWLFKGDGKSMMNNKHVIAYLGKEMLEQEVFEPLIKLNMLDKYNVRVSSKGGGLRGQAQAAKLGLARALVSMDENFREALRKAGLLSRDPRVKERKKYGRKRARKGFQFRKR